MKESISFISQVIFQTVSIISHQDVERFGRDFGTKC
jgi:hypothetical protein